MVLRNYIERTLGVSVADVEIVDFHDRMQDMIGRGCLNKRLVDGLLTSFVLDQTTRTVLDTFRVRGVEGEGVVNLVKIIRGLYAQENTQIRTIDSDNIDPWTQCTTFMGKRPNIAYQVLLRCGNEGDIGFTDVRVIEQDYSKLN